MKPDTPLRSLAPPPWVVVCGLGLVTASLYSLILGPIFPFQGGDSARYLFLARGILGGEGYLDLFTDPATPHTKYPFVFPLIIAAVTGLAGENIVILKVVLGGFVFLGAWGLYAIGRHRGEAWLGLLGALLLIGNHYAYVFSIQVLSEIPFTAFALWALYFSERYLQPDSALAPGLRLRYLGLTLLFLLLAYFTRSAGIVLLPALLLAMIYRRYGPLPPGTPPFRSPWGHIATAFGVFFVAAGAWALRNLWVAEETSAYLQEYLTSSSLTDGAAAWLAELAEQADYYLLQTSGIFFPWLDGQYLRAAGAVVYGLCAVGLIGSRRRLAMPEFYFVLFLLMVVVWHYQEPRFLVPVIGLGGYFALLGLRTLFALLASSRTPSRNSRTPHWIAGLLGVLFVGGHLLQSVENGREFSAEPDRTQAYPINPHFYLMAGSRGMFNMLWLAAGLREQADPEGLVLARKPALVALASGLHATKLKLSADPAVALQQIRDAGVRYIFADEVYARHGEQVATLVEAYPELFRVTLTQGESKVYEAYP